MRLAAFETMTWGEILTQGGRQNHLMPVVKICSPARTRLTARGQEDAEFVCSLRIGKAERIWGILDGAVLRVLWWDPEHLVYPIE